jgi:hypothetical protein
MGIGRAQKQLITYIVRPHQGVKVGYFKFAATV